MQSKTITPRFIIFEKFLNETKTDQKIIEPGCIHFYNLFYDNITNYGKGSKIKKEKHDGNFHLGGKKVITIPFYFFCMCK